MKYFWVVLWYIAITVLLVQTHFATPYIYTMLGFTAWFFIVLLINKYQWNNGKSRCCNADWKYFDTDSQGCEGFRCSNRECNNHIWI